VHPTDPNTIYVTFSGLRWNEPISHVYRTTNGGGSWTDVSGDLPEAPAHTILLDPENPSTLVVGNDVGVYWSANGGQTWQVLGTGLPRVPVFDLDFHPATRMIAAGTHGCSIFTTTMPDPVTAAPVPAAEALALTAAPNPFNPLTVLSFEVPSAGFASLEILDVRGRRVARPVHGELTAGEHQVRWEARDEAGRALPSGVYLARLVSGEMSTVSKLTLAR